MCFNVRTSKLKQAHKLPTPRVVYSCFDSFGGSFKLLPASDQIVAYDPIWPQRYLAEGVLVLQAIDPTFLSIEHVGSTAVPGLSAKPIIGMIAACREPLRWCGRDCTIGQSRLSIDRNWYARSLICVQTRASAGLLLSSAYCRIAHLIGTQ